MDILRPRCNDGNTAVPVAVRPEPGDWRSYFALIPYGVFADPSLGDGDIRVLGSLLSFCGGPRGTCWASVKSIGERVGKRPTATRDSLRNLERAGWVRREPDHARATHRRYSFTFLSDRPATSAPTVPAPRRPDRLTTVGGPSGFPEGGQRIPGGSTQRISGGERDYVEREKGKNVNGPVGSGGGEEDGPVEGRNPGERGATGATTDDGRRTDDDGEETSATAASSDGGTNDATPPPPAADEAMVNRLVDPACTAADQETTAAALASTLHDADSLPFYRKLVAEVAGKARPASSVIYALGESRRAGTRSPGARFTDALKRFDRNPILPHNGTPNSRPVVIPPVHSVAGSRFLADRNSVHAIVTKMVNVMWQREATEDAIRKAVDRWADHAIDANGLPDAHAARLRVWVGEILDAELGPLVRMLVAAG